MVNEYTGIEAIKNRPGLGLEKKYYEWLLACINRDKDRYRHGIVKFKWDSLTEKSSYDFAVDTLNYDGRIFIDIVGFQISASGSIRLNTAHKDFKSLLAELSDPNECGWYDCFKAYQAFFYAGEWLYLQVTENLPLGNITLDKKRFKTVRRAKTVFGDDVLKANAPHIDIENGYVKGTDIRALTAREIFG